MPRRILVIIITIVFLSFTFHSNVKADSSFSKHPSPVIISDPLNWDNKWVHYPSVLFENNTYKMWYAGHNNQTWSIGYATSDNGINWVKDTNNPVLSWNINNLSEPKHFNTPSVINDSGIYKMWYTSTPDDISNFRIAYANSSDGINWNKISFNIFANIVEPYWGSIGMASPSVIKVGSEYKMWMISAQTGNWRIGYATSPDGINWTPYAGNPIIVPTESWEGPELGGPSVTYDGSMYHMWYGTGNTPVIAYATSADGINWTKPAAQNPALQLSPTGFDSIVVGEPTVLQTEDRTYMYYVGLGTLDGLTKYRIGLATDPPIGATPSATPTPTDMPTPTPTPTSVPVSKVIVIPGLGGSYNEQAISQCTDVSTPWTNWQAADRVYAPVLQAINNSGYTTLPFYYDWRKPPTQIALQLKTFLSQNTSPGEHVYIVGHSMGGLVARAYIEQEGTNSRVDKLITVGTPHAGSILAYPVWSGGDVWGDIQWQAAALLTRLHCKRKHGVTQNREIYRQFFPSIQTLLPTTDYLFLRLENDPIPVGDMVAQNNWLPTQTFTPPFFGTHVATLIGIGEKTIDGLRVRDQSILDKKLGNWIDGHPLKRLYTNQGDSVVPSASALIPGADVYTVKEDHGGVIASYNGIQKILQFLGASSLSSLKQQQYTSPQEALLIVSTADPITVTDTEGKTYTGQDILIPSYKKGYYRIKTKGRKSGNVTTVRLNAETDPSIIEYYASQFFTQKSIWVDRYSN